VAPNQGVGAEMIAARWGFTRAQLDEFALRSHERAAKAQADGAFDEQIVPVRTPDGVVTADEGIRPGGTLEKLGALKTPFQADGVISAGNASQISDGAAALLVTTSVRARELGLTPMVRVHTTVVAGDDPVIMLTAPIPATRKLLQRSGVGLAEIGVFEVNEAFAPVPLAWQHDIGADLDAVNPLGGAIALGHPLGASGARITTTLVHHMQASGTRYGLQTMCEGGGMANATLLELLPG
jgi:acetyl-CoA acyltransferase